MTDNNDYTSQQKLEAALALALDTDKPEGEKPTLDEIIAWHEKCLPEPRFSQVAAHVARDTECYQQWYDYRVAQLEEPVINPVINPAEQSLEDSETKTTMQKQPSLFERLSNLISPVFNSGYGLAGLAASVMAVTFLAPMLMQSGFEQQLDSRYSAWDSDIPAASWGWDTRVKPKSLGSFKADSSQQSFRYGVKTGLQQLVATQPDWKVLIDQIQVTAVDCEANDTQCSKQSEFIENTGRWTLISYMDCVNQKLDIDKAKANLGEIAKQMETLKIDGKIASQFTRWQSIAKADKEGFCGQLSLVMDTGLGY